METIELLTLVFLLLNIALTLVLTALVLKGRRSPGERELLKALEEEKRQRRLEEERLRRELSDTVQSSMKVLGEILSINQKQASDATQRSLLQLEGRFKTLEMTNEQKLDAIRGTVDARLSAIQADNGEKLETIRKTVDEKLQKTMEETLSQTFSRVSRQLEEVYKGLGEMQTLAAGVGDLKKVLSNVKARGILGEYQLGAILEEILSPEQYAENVAVIPGSANRVEFAVKLPGEDGVPVWLPIDAKFPADAYEDLQAAYESGSPEEVNRAFGVLSARIRAFAKDIRDKYIEPPYTTAFGIMFLPFEGLYAEVVNRGLLEPLQREYGVNVAGPSTMAALLNALQMGFKTVAIQKRSSEVWKILGGVKTEFGKFEEVLSAAQKKLENVGKDLDRLVGVRTRAINRRLREVESLTPDEGAGYLPEDRYAPEDAGDLED